MGLDPPDGDPDEPRREPPPPEAGPASARERPRDRTGVRRTELESARAELRESEDKLRSLYQKTPVMLHSIDRQGVLLSVSDRWLEVLGYERDEVLGRRSTEFLTEASQRYAREVILPAFFEAGRCTDVAYQMVRKDGHVLDVLLSATAELDAEGQVARSVAVIVDVTERKRAEQALRYQAQIIAQTHDALVACDLDGRVTHWNPAAERIFGWSAEEATGRFIGRVLPDEDRVPLIRRLRAHLDAHPSWEGEMLGRTRAGDSLWVHVGLSLLRDDDGEAMGVIASVADLSERRRAEEARRRSEERLRAFVAAMPDLVMIVDGDGRVRDVLSHAEAALGGSGASLEGRTLADILPAGVAEGCLAAVRRTLAEGGTQVHEYALPLGGEVREFEARTAVVHGEGGGGHVVWLARDITDRKRTAAALLAKETERASLAEALRHAQKMEAIGTLAGGVAHDFNNLLTGILGYASLIKGDLPEGSGVRHAIDIIEQAASRGASLTRQLLGFARRGKQQHSLVDVHGLVREAVALLSRTIDRRITLVQRLGAESAMVMGDPDQIQQVVMNLAVNARDAMRDGGTLTLETSVVAVAKGGAPPRTQLGPGPYLRLAIEDSGAGIPEDIRDRVFEPFFTTKGPGEGTGLGLATVYGVVQNHGGDVRFDSQEGRGTRFEVFLPLAAPVAPAEELRRPSGPEAPDRPLVRRARVLVVDDEAIVRQTATAMLRALGYETVTAEDGEKALTWYRAHGSEVDLVILDMTMPVMNGHDCFFALKEIDPAVRVLVATGHSVDGTAQELMDEGLAGYVQKPFGLAELREAVRRALDPAA